MAFYTILFSPCGGTRRIAEILEREWKEEQRICIDPVSYTHLDVYKRQV